ncbi:oxidoreductase C-terminal domain-containing protein [Sphingomonas sp. Ant H11]|uniref:oxidoreductase C-terminal domain-containing protein n=1 Tax=Sphingomonas sp. Ant H11 TaxID=1564113 RepID=UPI0018CE8BEC|nr:oxidoreductase C-terminal domain-containing protein [Sphingomonas sp. Ant H11]
MRLESVHNALEQAKTAAADICGNPLAYDQVPWFWSDQYELKLQTAGLSQGYDQVVIRGNMATRSFAAFYMKDGRLLAVDAVNRPVEFTLAKRWIWDGKAPSPQQLGDDSIEAKALAV